MRNIKSTGTRTAFLLVLAAISGMFLFGAEAAAADYEAVGADETIVCTESDFKAALQNSDIATIYFGADIELTSRVTIAKRPGGTLTINGTDPVTGERHRYKDHFVWGGAAFQSNVSLYMDSSALTEEIIFRDIDLLGYNIYGVITCGSFQYDAITVVFDNVRGTYHEFVALFASTLIIRDSVLTVSNSDTFAAAEEAAEVSSLIFEGDVEIYHNSGSGYSLFNFYTPSEGRITVREGANVLLKTTYNAYGCFHFYVSGRSFTIEKDSAFTYIGRDRFSKGDNYGRLDSFTVGEGAKATLIMPEYNTQALTPGGLNADTVTVNKGGSLSVFANAAYIPLKTTELNLYEPGRVILYNAGSGNVVQPETGFRGVGLKSVRYYTTAGDSYDFADNSYNDSRPGYSHWFFQETGLFDAAASNGGKDEVSGLSSTYSGGDAYSPMSLSGFSAGGEKGSAD